MPFVVGLDLGQEQDPTALAVLEQTEGPDPARPGARCWHYACVHLERYPLGTPYVAPHLPWPESVGDWRPDMADRIKRDRHANDGIVELVQTLLSRPPLPGAPLAVDQTGVGRPVVDLFRSRNLPCVLHAITITAGAHVTQEGWDWTVPKRDLVACVQTLLQSSRIKIAEELSLCATLTKELSAFRYKKTTANDLYGTWREGDHDDIVLAVALAAWLGERCPPLHRGSIGLPKGDRVEARGFSRPPPGVFGGGSFSNPPRW
jgi:hypothetical protein